MVIKDASQLRMRPSRMIEVHGAPTRHHEDVAHTKLDAFLRHPIRKLNDAQGFHPFHRAVLKMASSKETVGLNPKSHASSSTSGV